MLLELKKEIATSPMQKSPVTDSLQSSKHQNSKSLSKGKKKLKIESSSPNRTASKITERHQWLR